MGGFSEYGDGSGEKFFSENSVGVDGDAAQPNSEPSLEEAGDLGSGLLRLLLSVLVESIVVCGLLSFGPIFKCGGGGFRENTDMVGGLLKVLMGLSTGSSESVGRASAWSEIDS